MAGLWGPCSQALLLLWAGMLLLLLPPELGLAVGRSRPAAAQALSGALSLPLVRVLLGQAPPLPPPHSKPRRQAGEGEPLLRFMLDLYRSMADRHGRPRKNRQLTTNTIRLVRPVAKTRQPTAGPQLVWHLDYRLEVQTPLERLVRATVVYSRTQASAGGLLLCSAQALMHPGAEPRAAHTVAHPHTDAKGAASSSSSYAARDSWVEMDLSADLQPWAWAAQKSWVLQLSHACSSVGQPWGPSPDPGWEDAVTPNDPFFLLYLNDTTSTTLVTEVGGLGEAPFYAAPPRRPAQARQARQAGELALGLPSNGSSNRRASIRSDKCSLHPFRVSFRQLGWDHWIIAPRWYRPQYCKGSCPRVLHSGFQSLNHAIVQNYINELVDQTVPRPSCVPYEYRPISVLMKEQNGNILYKVYKDMIAKSCTCR